ncbi:MAG: MarR family winged helix-turn-helix transcriptional regulator [Defluviitaleaceae bacterium]|nr:MarR family winged helix-turn-helix transcriptional regulator [Defluviitaleaceae bacterium]
MDNDTKKALFSALKETWHKMNSQFDLYAKAVGVNFTTIIILQFLYEATEIYTQKDICEKLGLPKQLVNAIIKSFWEQGFVKLKEAKDRRNKDILITDKGKEYAVSVLKPLEDAESAAWDNFTDEELTAFVRVLEKYVVSFERELKELK